VSPRTRRHDALGRGDEPSRPPLHESKREARKPQVRRSGARWKPERQGEIARHPSQPRPEGSEGAGDAVEVLLGPGVADVQVHAGAWIPVCHDGEPPTMTNSTPSRASASINLPKSIATRASHLFEKRREAPHTLDVFGRRLPEALFHLGGVDARRYLPQQLVLPGGVGRRPRHRRQPTSHGPSPSAA